VRVVTPLEAARVTCGEDEDSRVVALVERAIREDRERRRAPVEGLDVAAIRARCEAATPGPWWQGDTDEHEEGDADCVYVRDDDAGRMVWRMAGPFVHEEDAAFVAEARQDVSALLAEVERIAARLDAADEGAMRVALDGGCCARHVAMGMSPGPCMTCGPLTRDDVAAIAEAATEATASPDGLDDEMDETLRCVLVLCATLAGRLP